MVSAKNSLLLVMVAIVSYSTVSVYAADAALTPEELAARHLDAIGNAATRSAAKTRAVQGAATYRMVVGGGGHEDGKMGLVSDGQKLRFLVRFPQRDYAGENFLFNGDVAVTFANSNQSRSPISSFVTSQDVIVRDGLLGGVLSTAWPLLDLTGRGAKLKYEGEKSVDGRKLYQVRYEPRKHTELEILLFFDPETMRHVKTMYSLAVGSNVGPTVLDSARMQPQRTTLEEWFSDFATNDGVTLPTHWKMQFTRELPDGSTTIAEWDMKPDQVQSNISLDPRNFAAK